MSDTLRNQLLGLGFKAAVPERKEGRPNHGRPKDGGPRDSAPRDIRPRDGRPNTGPRPPGSSHAQPRSAPRPGDARRPGGAPSTKKRDTRTREEIDLAKAYAIRAQREKEERIAAEAAKQEEACRRREARAQLAELLKDKGLNVADADIARHFPYGGKIKRVYVTAEQLRALNAGELGVVQVEGRYMLVTAEVLAEAERVFAPAVALKVDPNAPAEDDPYADPKYQVPDDLVW
ncbi:DUF2058 domain-containing protein [Cognatilysobacter bugurensis]|uniref:DUF2058 family protein n=1 Tax=Cognatilysobacter bugurensis TaxID=543356 RepID=A0A918SUL5_9GAMM|nr:DUF2058 family protein [Lysobacter bugurensis]GHA71667.1 hypothetical protein GCM10007067_05080 [Lysobacter bugurensis]